jgi:ribosomal protein L37E
MRIKDMTPAQLNEYHRKKQRGYREQHARERLAEKERCIALGLPVPGSKTKPTHITCKGCGETFPYNAEHFYLSRHGYSVHRCRPCAKRQARRMKLARSYGITLEEYEAALKTASCEICGEADRLVLDHCHGTGKARGILCNSCNVMLGIVRDDVSILEAAIRYLQK